ncbi:MAG: sulfatase-like hydrolase/transferase [Myxococcota bacterium]|nr:sulfatase-like hydrolase/transferase [Myxococcota bacterium]
MTARSTYFQEMLHRRVLIQFIPIAALLFIETIAFKAVQIHRLTDHLLAGPILASMAQDIIFIGPTVLIAAFFYSNGSTWQKRLVKILFFAVMGCALLVTTFSNGYFHATGSLLSWHTIQYWLRNTAVTNEIMASEAGVGQVAIIALQVVFLIAAILIPFHAGVARWAKNKKPPSPGQTRGVLWGCLVVFVGCLLLPSPRGKTAAISRSVPITIATGAIGEMIENFGSVEIAAEERQGSPLRFTTTPGAPRPNIVFIIFESLNWKLSDIHTPGIGTTPFLASLAEKSAVIEHIYSIVPHTTKAVMPLLCGIYPYFRTKPVEATPGILPRRCLAHILGDIGYRTAFFQPANNFEKRSGLVANMGFDLFKGAKDMPTTGFESISYFGFEDKVMLGPSMDWVDADDTTPFFLTYLTLATHHNYVTPQSFPYVDFKKPDKDLNNFMNAVRYVDSFIKDVFDAFEARGLMDNTVFIIAGDHGEAFTEHGRRQHDLIMWEEGLRTTALIYAPKFFPEGTSITGIRSNLDFVPTVCDLLEMTLVQGKFIGQSLLGPVPEDRALFHSCWFEKECLAMHNGPIKTIYHYESQPMEVYDIFKDPLEQDNLAGTGPYDQTYLDEKKQQMLRFRSVTNQQYKEWRKDLSTARVTRKKPAMKTDLRATFGNTVQITGVNAPEQAMAGTAIKMAYLFKSINKAGLHDQIFVHVVHGQKYINADHVPVRGTMPMHRWRPGDYILDEQAIHIPGTWPDGEVKVYLGVWNKRKNKRYPITNASGETDRGRLLVATIPLKGAVQRQEISIDETRKKIAQWIGFDPPQYEKEMGVVFGDAISLEGVTLERTNVMLAGTVEMTYVFKALGKALPTWRLAVYLIREDGFTMGKAHTPIGGLYPLHHWREGEYVVDRHRIHIDMYRSKTGTYGVWLGIRNGSKPVPAVGSGEIDTRGRVRIGTVTIAEKDARQ